jgi:hypothetical protein
LLIKSFWWAAWWPVSTWLLMGEGRKPESGRRGQLRAQESNMANDAFMKPEVPDSFRELMKVSIE